MPAVCHPDVFITHPAARSCHAATVTFLSDGRPLVAWFGGSGEGDPDTAVYAAVWTGSAWSPPRLLFKLLPVAHWNPVLFAPADGTLRLFFQTGWSPRNWGSWISASVDDGETWSDPVRLGLPEEPVGPIRTPPIVSASGAWIAGCSWESTSRWDAHASISRDGGRTWTAHPVSCRHADLSGKGLIQPAVWQSRPGHIHMLLRSTAGRIYRSDSADDGRTWSAAYATDLPNNNSGIAVCRHGDTLWLACNPVERGRTPLTLLTSSDNGATWTTHTTVESGEGEYSYPTLVAVPDAVWLVYTWQRQRIRFHAAPV